MAKADIDRIEKQIELAAPRERVWRALSTAKELGTWFGLGMPLELEGEMVPGATIVGTWQVDGREVRETFCTVEAVEAERLLVFRWVPYELPEGEDPAAHPTTRIEFRLEEIAGGTRLTVVESGFAKLPADKQYKREQNGDGWALQLHAIGQHVLGRVAVEIEDHVARPVAAVFEAIVDPARMAQYFLSKGSARMESGTRVTWEWADVGAALAVDVREVIAGEKVVFLWSATGTPTQVTLAIEAEGERTKIRISEIPFELSADGAARAVRQMRGWAEFCCGLKAYVQHGVNLRAGKPADDVA